MSLPDLPHRGKTFVARILNYFLPRRCYPLTTGQDVERVALTGQNGGVLFFLQTGSPDGAMTVGFVSYVSSVEGVEW